jgi:hypothetical protein
MEDQTLRIKFVRTLRFCVMIFESGKNGANLVTSCRNCTCWTRSTVSAQRNLVTLRPGGRREEGYVIATKFSACNRTPFDRRKCFKSCISSAYFVN